MMNPQENSTPKSNVWTFLPEDVRKFLPIVLLVVSVIFFVSLHSDCWFSINCHVDSQAGFDVSAIMVGFAATFTASAVFGAPITVATGVGILCWLVLKFWV